MSDHDDKELSPFSRRELLAATAGLASLGAAGGSLAAGHKFSGKRRGKIPQPPFDSIRDWMAMLEAHGLVLRVPEIDQDKYHATALFFRMTDMYGAYASPAVLFEKIKVDGQWMDGPVIGNVQGHWFAEALLWGIEPDWDDYYNTYWKTKAHMAEIVRANGGFYPEIPPVEIPRDKAPIKEVVLKGDDIDITQFPFVQTNPADGGRYVNTGSHFMVDAEMGPNFGTYRCQIKAPRKLGVNPEPNQTNWKMLMAAKERGDKYAKLSIVLGQDPVVWMISGTRIAPRFGPKPKPIDELAIAGGMRGKPVEVVKSEDSDILIPAHAEMVIEGTVPLQEPMEPEGPFGEMFGYLGQYKEENFWMTINTITHRKNPWIMNAFTGMQKGMVTAPMEAMYDEFLRRRIPNLVHYHTPQYAMGCIFMSIDKTEPFQGIKAGKSIVSGFGIAKVVIVVDKDVNVLNHTEVLAAVGARWQPAKAHYIVEDGPGLFTDPSQPSYGRTSKIVIDATRQLPEEGGKEDFPEANRALLEKGAPNAIAEVNDLFLDLLKDWGMKG
ncbi:MAG: UbiD family decarboxylase [Gammaproteobacteria bacterium]|nr:UbiD family decarboxylase [Gammaproteobacteria bacterium]